MMPQKNKNKEKKQEIKREKGETLVFLLKDPHSYSKVISSMHNYVGILTQYNLACIFQG